MNKKNEIKNIIKKISFMQKYPLKAIHTQAYILFGETDYMYALQVYVTHSSF